MRYKSLKIEEKNIKKGSKTCRQIGFLLLLGVLVTVFFLYKVQIQNAHVGTGYEDPFLESIPTYDGRDCIVLNDNRPDFAQEYLDTATGENYSELDGLGRCGVAVALLDRSMMPTGERGEIGSVRPSGWVQAKYPEIIDSKPPYLYNRCHLIGYMLTGQNANDRNLITGTRYLNAELMLPYETRVARYLDHSDNHVLYRVTPHFKGDELVARGVEMEAYSVEDGGAGVCFHVFLYNIQPGIEIDYRTGESRAHRP